jgi:hypothetical protein
MIQQTKHRSIVGPVLERQVQVTVTAAILRLTGLRVFHHEIVHHARVAAALDGHAQGQISVLVGARDRRGEAREDRLDGHLLHGLAVAQQEMEGQVPVLVGALGAREILRQEAGDDAHARVVTARDVQRKAAAVLLARAMDHGVGALGRLGEEELDRLRRVELGRDVDGLTAAGVDVGDALLVSAVYYFEGGDVVVGRGVMERQRSDGILVKQCFGVEHQDHVHQQRPHVGVTAYHVQDHLAVGGIEFFGQLGVLIERALDGRPVFLRDEVPELDPFAGDFHDGLALVSDGYQLLLVRGGFRSEIFFEGTSASERRLIERRMLHRVDRRSHGLVQLVQESGDVHARLESSDQGLNAHAPVQGAKIPHARIGPAHDGLDLDGSGDENLVQLEIKQPIDVLPVASLDDDGGHRHLSPDEATVRPGLDAPHRRLDGQGALPELLRPQRLDAIEGLPPQEHLGPAELQAGDGAPARKIQGQEVLRRVGAGDAAGDEARIGLAALFGEGLFLALVRRGEGGRDGGDVHVAVHEVLIAGRRVPRTILQCLEKESAGSTNE